MSVLIGYNHKISVRTEKHKGKRHCSFKIMFLSDFHFNSKNENIVGQIENSLNEQKPDIILLGGDYIDTKKGILHFERLLAVLSTFKHVFAVAGNHDYFFGIEKVKALVEKHAVTWIENKSFEFLMGDFIVQVDGNILTENSHSENLFKILCLHKPKDFSLFSEKYNLAFAGHLHGGQFVLWKNEKGLYPGKYFYKHNFEKRVSETCSYFIGKGLADTLPLRLNCEKEVLVVNVD